jgi:adenosine deaminase
MSRAQTASAMVWMSCMRRIRETLLKDMAARRVLVEINLTSNEDVLGVSGKNHPFPVYRKFGVPVALSTDDEGIERIDLTREYVRVSGVSLWAGPDFARLADACGGDVAGAERRPRPARRFSKGWELEKRFQAFEGGF